MTTFTGVIRVQDGRENYTIEAKTEKAARKKIAKVFRVGESMVLSCVSQDAPPAVPNAVCPTCGQLFRSYRS